MLMQIRALTSLIALTCQVQREALAFVENVRFRAARFVGNESAEVLAYSADVSIALNDVSLAKCGSRCKTDSSRGAVNCHSFNFIPNRGDKGSGRCELINSEAWFPGNFVTRLADSASQFFVKSTYLHAYYFQIIPAVHGGNANPSIRPWSTDCMTLGGVAGFVVAMRNNRNVSMYTDDFKCRVFRHSLALANTATAVPWNSPNYDMRCPNGSVITAVYDAETWFPHANSVRCQQVLAPWRVNNSACYRINIYRPSASWPVSPMNDWGLKGTKDSVWGVQCGNDSRYTEALTAIKLRADLVNDNVECCPLYPL